MVRVWFVVDCVVFGMKMIRMKRKSPWKFRHFQRPK